MARVFERRMGSHKFASHLLATGIMSLVLQVAAVMSIRAFGWDSYHSGHLPPGPYEKLPLSFISPFPFPADMFRFFIRRYELIFPLFVPYLLDVPRVTRTHILGIPITGKTVVYLVGLQVCSTSLPTAITAICCIVSWKT